MREKFSGGFVHLPGQSSLHAMANRQSLNKPFRLEICTSIRFKTRVISAWVLPCCTYEANLSVWISFHQSVYCLMTLNLSLNAHSISISPFVLHSKQVKLVILFLMVKKKRQHYFPCNIIQVVLGNQKSHCW